MRLTSRLVLCAVLMGLVPVASAEAALIDRGGGLIYDTVLDVTWMQDASYIQRSAGVTGMNWTDAVNWAAGLEYYDPIRGIVWDDWRLPTTIDDPSSLGYDLTGASSELAYMYYVNLGYAPNYTHDRFTPVPTSTNYNPFVNLNYRGYWSGTGHMPPGGRQQAWYLHFHFGSQEIDNTGTAQRVWAVRDGDVGEVPEPATSSLLALGILFAVRRSVAVRSLRPRADVTGSK